MLSEQRELVATVPRADGSYTIDWRSTFTACDRDVVFERTPPEKASWGGYGGLGFRAAKTMGQFHAIDSEGHFLGSVSGGCVEGAVVTEALDVIESGAPRTLEFGVADETAWRVGLSCGGRIKVYVERVEA